MNATIRLKQSIRCTGIVAMITLGLLLLAACQPAAVEPTQAEGGPSPQSVPLQVRTTAVLAAVGTDGNWLATVSLDVVNGQPPFTYEAAWPRVGSGEPATFGVSGASCTPVTFAATVKSADGQEHTLRIGIGPVSCAIAAFDPALVATLASAGVATPEATAPATTGVPAASPPPQAADALALDLLNRVNALRQQNGLPPYAYNEQLAAAALRHSQDMATTGNISHTGSDGSTAQQRILDAGYPATASAEGLYAGASLDDAWNFWSTDPDHRPNLLSSQYEEMGFAAVTGASLTYYTTTFGAQEP